MIPEENEVILSEDEAYEAAQKEHDAEKGEETVDDDTPPEKDSDKETPKKPEDADEDDTEDDDDAGNLEDGDDSDDEEDDSEDDDDSDEEEELTDEEKAEKEKTEKAELVKKFAEDEGFTEEEAIEELDHIDRLSQKYEGDSKKTAKALLSSLRGVTKLQEHVKTLETELSQRTIITEDELSIAGKIHPKSEVIEAYRETNDKYQDADKYPDEVLLDLAIKDLEAENKKSQDNYMSDMKSKASVKTKDLLGSVTQEEKKFIPEMKAVISQGNTLSIMSENFTKEVILRFVKGNRYSADLKTHGESEYKRGLENRKTAPIAPKKGKGPKKGKVPSLTKAQIDEVYEDFGEITTDTKKAYLEVQEHKKKVKAKNKEK